MSKALKTTLPKGNKQNARTPKPAAPKQGGGQGWGWAILFMAPSLIGTGIFYLFPFIDTVRRSFFNARGDTFIGLEAYKSVFKNPTFQLAAKNTLRFILVCVPLLLATSLVSALIIRAVSNAGEKGGHRSRFFKTSLLLPMALPVASIALLWQVLFHNNGIINTALSAVGLPGTDFLNTGAAFWVLVFTYLWKNTGYDMVLWLAGLDGISKSLYEAAKVDGASARECFWHITLPGLAPTVGLISILSLINSFKVFREAYLVAGPYPHDSMYLLQHLFNNWFQNLDISRLCAAAVLLCAVLLLFILPMQHFLKAETDEG